MTTPRRGNTVTFPTHRLGESQTFHASRPEVLSVLKDASEHGWGYHVELAGTREELLGAGVAASDMFTHFGKTGVRTAGDEYGNQWTIQRRAGGRFELTLRTFHSDDAQDIDSKRFRALLAWREHGQDVEREVAQALERMRRARGVA